MGKNAAKKSESKWVAMLPTLLQSTAVLNQASRQLRLINQIPLTAVQYIQEGEKALAWTLKLSLGRWVNNGALVQAQSRWLLPSVCAPQMASDIVDLAMGLIYNLVSFHQRNLVPALCLALVVAWVLLNETYSTTKFTRNHSNYC